MSRPVDVVLDFLETARTRGVSHVHLDEGAREGLRELFLRARNGGNPPPGPAPDEPPPPEPEEPAILETPATGDRHEKIAALKRQAENWPPARKLGTLRDVMVFSAGNPEARVMLVGEAPGYREEIEREPFVGPAGQKLNDILKAMGLAREDVYLSNIVKFRPATPRQTTNNRKPTADEMAACLPFVRQEIAIVKPACVVALGGTAAEGLLGLEGTVTAMRGAWHDFEGTPVRVSYHPSYLLQSAGASNVKRQVWEDMLAVMEKLSLPISEKQRAFFLPKP